MTRRLLALLLVLFSAGLGARAAYACSCVPAPPVEELVAEAKVAFAGEVLRVSGDRYVTRVDTVIKGSVPREVSLHSDPRSACAARLDLGPILYTGGRDLAVHQCSFPVRGEQVSYALRSLGLPAPTTSPPAVPPAAAPAPDDGPPWPLLLSGAGAAVVAAGGLLTWRSRRTAGGSETMTP
jgi:hypothetical protein